MTNTDKTFRERFPALDRLQRLACVDLVNCAETYTELADDPTYGVQEQDEEWGNLLSTLSDIRVSVDRAYREISRAYAQWEDGL